jgi:D-glycero-D-manno-heptose 1,7-bisphosphate phosphatase
MPCKAFILDRDGVINQEIGTYVNQLSDFHWQEGIFELTALAQRFGYQLFIITNQGGVAKGVTDVNNLKEIHRYMLTGFADKGVLFQELFVCHHHPAVSQCLCRKPESLFYERILAKYYADPLRSIMLGDRERDLQPARQLGLTTLIIGDEEAPSADFRFQNLLQVAVWLENREKNG